MFINSIDRHCFVEYSASYYTDDPKNKEIAKRLVYQDVMHKFSEKFNDGRSYFFSVRWCDKENRITDYLELDEITCKVIIALLDIDEAKLGEFVYLPMADGFVIWHHNGVNSYQLKQVSEDLMLYEVTSLTPIVKPT